MGLFSKKPSAKTIIGEVSDLGDRWFTQDSERQDFQYKMAVLAAKSDNVIARTGRGAIMWMLALTGAYNFIVRDLIGLFLERELPPPAIDVSDLLEYVIGVLGGTL